MSVLYNSEIGCVICHEKYIKSVYEQVFHENDIKSVQLNPSLFKIISPFSNKSNRSNLKRQNSDNENKFVQLQEEVEHVQKVLKVLYFEAQAKRLFHDNVNLHLQNIEALEAAEKAYDESGKNSITHCFGANENDAVFKVIKNNNYLFPKDCKFYCKDVLEIRKTLASEMFDLVLLDPPWWNKYIRRKKAKTDHGYQMMYSDDLKTLPIGKLVSEEGLVVVWCTNSPQHLDTLINVVFPEWGLSLVAKWFWVKVTCSGKLVCDFSRPPGKQPFEQIVIGCRNLQKFTNIQDGKLVLSVPSALHSHKPPLFELLRCHLPEQPRCIEIFARYLLPGWTSWGLEALRFQHESLYTSVTY